LVATVRRVLPVVEGLVAVPEQLVAQAELVEMALQL
jgi:hypothetical protein